MTLTKSLVTPAAVLAAAAGACAQPSFAWRCGSGWYATCGHLEMCGGPDPVIVVDNNWYVGGCGAPAPFPFYGESPVISPVEPGKQMVQINPGEHTWVDGITLDSSFLPATLRIAADVLLQTGGNFNGTVEFFGGTGGLYNSDQDHMTLEFFGPLKFLQSAGVGFGGHTDITTYSSVEWTSGSITLTGGLTTPSTWLNLGVMDVTCDGQFTGGTSTFLLNEGTLHKGLTTGETEFFVRLVNTVGGVVDIDSGILTMHAGGESKGTWNIAAGSEVRVQQPYTMKGGTVIQGSGYARITNGPVTVEGLVEADRFSIADIGGFFSPTLDGPGELRISEDLLWTSGRMEGSGITRIMPGATLTVPAYSDRVLQDRFVHNEGTMNWSGNAIAGSGWTLVNDGPMNITADAMLSGHPTGALLVNNSLIRKDSPGETRIFRATYETSPLSAIEVVQGTLKIDGVEFSGLSSGDWIVHAGATLELGQGVHSLLAGTDFPVPSGGQGTVRISHGTVNLDDPALHVTLKALDMATAQAKIGGSGDLTVTGSFVWQGGELATSGTVLAAMGTTVDMTSPESRVVTTGTFRNHGNIVSAGSLALADGAVFENGNPGAGLASWEYHGVGTIVSLGSGGSIVNNGLFHRASGAGELQIQVPFQNTMVMGMTPEVRLSAGFVRFMGPFTQTHGRLILENDAQASFDPHLDPGNGTLEGQGTILGPVVIDDGNMYPGNVQGADIGRLAIAGSLTMDTGQGALAVDIAGTAPSDYDRLEVAGPASISGEIRPEILGFVPEDGQEFTVMTCASGITGEFDGVLQPSGMPAGLEFAARYTSDSVVLRVVRTCYPDCNLDGALTIGDFGCFQAQFVGSHPSADCNGNGSLTIADFGCFQAAFLAACP